MLLLLAGCSSQMPAFEIVEATVEDVHAAFRTGSLSSETLVQLYLDRIEAYDDSINAFIMLNPHALAEAAALDAEYAKTGVLRPLHGIPVVVKDNYDTADMQTTGGSAALEGLVPPDDAWQVARLKEAGVVILGKTNMAEWAFSPYVTFSSIDGTTHNPYDLSRVPAGSSGGTAAAVAATASAAAEPVTDELFIRSPMVGTFYLASDPESPPFVTIGDAVSPDRVVCIIEAMKVFNEINAEVSGRILRVLVNNAEAVESDQPLFAIVPV